MVNGSPGKSNWIPPGKLTSVVNGIIKKSKKNNFLKSTIPINKIRQTAGKANRINSFKIRPARQANKQATESKVK